MYTVSVHCQWILFTVHCTILVLQIEGDMNNSKNTDLNPDNSISADAAMDAIAGPAAAQITQM